MEADVQLGDLFDIDFGELCKDKWTSLVVYTWGVPKTRSAFVPSIHTLTNARSKAYQLYRFKKVLFGFVFRRNKPEKKKTRS